MPDDRRDGAREAAEGMDAEDAAPLLGGLQGDDRTAWRRALDGEDPPSDPGQGPGHDANRSDAQDRVRDAAKALCAAAAGSRFGLEADPADKMLAVSAQRPLPEFSREIISGDLYRDKASHLLSDALVRWSRRYAYETRQGTAAAKATAMMVFADMEVEMGSTLDWACTMSAAEGIPTGVWIAQVVQQFRDALQNQARTQRQMERSAERQRKRIGEVARKSASAVVALGDALSPGGRSDERS